jgi:aminomuconate-semialdehyde/2-hydroxymuconate-6-semialdehyde dehydrogenase
MTTATKAKTIEIDNFIGGKAVKSKDGKTFQTISPGTGEVLGTVSCGTADDINLAVEAAKEAYENGPWPKMSMADRANILLKVAALVEKNADELARAETLDTGKPITESRTGDIARVASNFQFYPNFAQSLAVDSWTPNPQERHTAIREPLGVCGLITPWNLPLYLATWKIAPCLIMGNACVLKPAEWTPYTAFLFAKLAKEAGVPDGVLNIVNGFGAGGAGEALTKHPDVKSISFTGETGTGRAIMASAAGTLKKLSFELGGKGANIIFEDANLEEALPTAVRAAYRNQGQVCLAGSRLFVQESIYPQVVKAMVERVKNLKVGDPLDPKTEMGALISKEHMEKVQGYIELGRKEGKCLTGGDPIKELGGGFFLSPSVFEGLAYDSKFCQEEIFGPVLPIIPFKDEEEVIKMANSTPYGLSASLWSQDVNRCNRVARKLKSGMVWVNCWFARDLRTPFGGQKSSGLGREGGRYSLEFFSDWKAVSYKYSD